MKDLFKGLSTPTLSHTGWTRGKWIGLCETWIGLGSLLGSPSRLEWLVVTLDWASVF